MHFKTCDFKKNLIKDLMTEVMSHLKYLNLKVLILMSLKFFNCPLITNNYL